MRKHSNIVDVKDRAKGLKWTWAGHAQRLKDDRWTKVVGRWKPVEKRKIGRPKTRWRDEIEENAGLLWRKKTIKRDLWRNIGKSFV
jgi:hypothetical protein